MRCIADGCSLQGESEAEVGEGVPYQGFIITNRKDTSLLNNTGLQILDFVLTIIYPPKLWRFMSLMFEKYQITKKVRATAANHA